MESIGVGRLTFAALIGAAVFCLHGPAWAASVVSVTTQSNSSVAEDGECSLLEAFNAAQDSAVGDCELVVSGGTEPLIIRLQPNATYLNMDGVGIAFDAFESVEVDGQDAVIGRDPTAASLFPLVSAFGPGKALTLRNLTLRDAEAEQSPALSANVASLHLERVNFLNNHAVEDEFGGAGTGGAFVHNNGGQLTIVGCRFQGNFADRIAGALALNGATAVISDTVFIGNESGGSAGALNARGSDLQIHHSAFVDNIALIQGGAVDMEPNTRFVIDSTAFTGNAASFGQGGAIDINGPLIIRRSLFSNNVADNGGALYYAPTPLPVPALVIENSTFHENRANSIGGAIRQERGMIELISATVVDNQASSGGGIFVANQGSMRLDHSIVVGNNAPIAADCVGPRDASGGYSLLGSGCEFSVLSTDIEDVDASAVDTTLRDNGGPTLTLAVTPGEAAHNGGDREYLQTTDTDQRGLPRIAEGRVDIGAHEYGAEAVDGLVDVRFSTSFEDNEPRRFFDRQAFLDATGAGDVTGPFPGSGSVNGEQTISNITFIPFGTASLNFSSWTPALPDLGGPGGTNDLALNDFEEFDMRSQNPVTAFGFDFVDPGGDGTPFNLLACASAFDANSERCPITDIVFSMDFSATDNNRNFVGFQVSRAIQQVSIREQTNSNTNEFFGHVFTAP